MCSQVSACCFVGQIWHPRSRFNPQACQCQHPGRAAVGSRGCQIAASCLPATQAAGVACSCTPAGGLGLPPKMLVMRRMKVDLPQPAMQQRSGRKLAPTPVTAPRQRQRAARELTRVSGQTNDHCLAILGGLDTADACPGPGLHTAREHRSSIVAK
jgi:hypothetical protein